MTEAFICDVVRTPIGRFAGALAHVLIDDLGATPMKALMARNASAADAAADQGSLCNDVETGRLFRDPRAVMAYPAAPPRGPTLRLNAKGAAR